MFRQFVFLARDFLQLAQAPNNYLCIFNLKEESTENLVGTPKMALFYVENSSAKIKYAGNQW